MTYEELLIYSARLGEFNDVKLCIEEKIDLNETRDASGNTALRKQSYSLLISQTWLVRMGILRSPNFS